MRLKKLKREWLEEVTHSYRMVFNHIIQEHTMKEKRDVIVYCCKYPIRYYMYTVPMDMQQLQQQKQPREKRNV